jgi:hypothetical protein
MHFERGQPGGGRINQRAPEFRRDAIHSGWESIKINGQDRPRAYSERRAIVCRRDSAYDARSRSPASGVCCFAEHARVVGAYTG